MLHNMFSKLITIICYYLKVYNHICSGWKQCTPWNVAHMSNYVVFKVGERSVGITADWVSELEKLTKITRFLTLGNWKAMWTGPPLSFYWRKNHQLPFSYASAYQIPRLEESLRFLVVGLLQRFGLTSLSDLKKSIVQHVHNISWHTLFFNLWTHGFTLPDGRRQCWADYRTCFVKSIYCACSAMYKFRASINVEIYEQPVAKTIQ